MSESYRLFIAINLPDETRTAIQKEVRQLKRKISGIGWVKVENMHLTLRFLGDVPVDAQSPVEEAMREAVEGVAAFELDFNRFGVFPSYGRPRVAWLGLEETSEALMRLQANLEGALERQGFEREEKEFTPHLTIGRVRDRHSSHKIRDILKSLGPVDTGAFQAEKIHLIRSQLRPKGAEYTLLHSVRLGEQEEGEEEGKAEA